MAETDKASPWYEDWFNDENYLKLYADRDEIEAEALIDIIQRATQYHPQPQDKKNAPDPIKVLDVACGPGRHAIAMAKRHFEVTAVDLSTKLLHHAHARAQKEKVNIRFLQLDMKGLDFDDEFDLAVQLFTSFGYFATDEEDIQVLQGVHRSLRDTGLYVLDLINPQVLAQTLVGRSLRKVDGMKVIEERRIEGGRVIKDITLQKGRTKTEYQESVRLYRPETIERMLREAGFLPTHWFGDYAGLPFDQEKSRRMIIVNKVV